MTINNVPAILFSIAGLVGVLPIDNRVAWALVLAGGLVWYFTGTR